MIAVDAMGGDFAPQEIVAGALSAAKEGYSIVLCGPKRRLEDLLDKECSSWRLSGLTVEHAPTQIAMGEDPVKAVRAKLDSSLVRAVALVQQGRASAVVSAGNSGALMCASTFLLGRQAGIERPAIAAFLPTSTGKTLCLDLGANADCKPSYLAQFARLGDAYLRKVEGMSSPRVGILSNGAEEGKGSLLVKQASVLLSQELELNFVGNVEPASLAKGCVDLLVTDGFSGNVLLKTFEAAASLFKLSDDSPVARVMHSQGGALLLGVRGTVVVAHGCAQRQAIAQAISLAASAATTQSNYIVRRTHETGKSGHTACS